MHFPHRPYPFPLGPVRHISCTHRYRTLARYSAALGVSEAESKHAPNLSTNACPCNAYAFRTALSLDTNRVCADAL